MGLRIAYQPTGVKIQDNTTNGNAGDGILLQGTHCNSPNGSFYCSPFNNVVSGNAASGNRRDGIDLGIGASSNTVARNSVSGNGVDGIVAALGAASNTLTQNAGSGDVVDDGFDANLACGTNSWTKNSFGTVNRSCV